MTELEDFRQRKDHFFRSGRESPLTVDQRRDFTGLAYYPENHALVIDAALEEPTDRGVLTMETSTGDSQDYHRAGVVRFTVEGQLAAMTLYSSGHDDRFFVPFRDATSGTETYGAGRYLEVDPTANGRVIVDFNYAYNPYCAYNAQWSCPLPPIENWLKVPIRAGEKDFPGRAEH